MEENGKGKPYQEARRRERERESVSDADNTVRVGAQKIT